MIYGKANIVTEHGNYSADIIHVENGRDDGCKYYPQTWEQEEEKIEIIFDKLICECYDLTQEDIPTIKYIELEELRVDLFSDKPTYQLGWGMDLEIISVYYDFGSVSLVLECK